jgi:hypothetical protein
MSVASARSVFLRVAVLLVAGCAGSGSPASTQLATSQGIAGAGMPITVAPRHALTSQTVHPTYATTSSLVFEADLKSQTVNVYKTGTLKSNPAPIVSFKTKSGCPDGLALDKAGTLYVADECNGNDVEEFPKGSTTEKTDITGISNPSGLIVDKNGTLYVSTYPASIEEFALGSTTPKQVISGQGLTDPFGLALDKSQNLYVADFGAKQVFEIKFGTTTVTALNLQGTVEPLGVAIDQKLGDLWEIDGSGNKINVYKLGSTSPYKTIAGHGFPYAASAQNSFRPNGTVVTSDITSNAVYAFKAGQYAPYATLTNGVGEPISLLIAKP